MRLVIPGIAVSPGVTHSDSRIVFVTGTVVKPQQPTNNGDKASKARGLVLQLCRGEYIIGIKMALTVVDLLEDLNRAVQSKTTCISSSILTMQTTQQLLMNLRNDDAFNQIYKETLELCKKLDYPVPTLPRKRRLPAKLAGNSASYEWATPEEFHRAQYFAFIDTACEALARRYNQPGLHKYADMEKLFKRTVYGSRN